MTSGHWVVLGVFGALALVVGIVVAAFLLFEPEGAPCETGELASNRLVEGQYVTRTESFERVEQAEAFICHGVPRLQADGWTLESIEAERTVPTEFLVEGEGLGIVTLVYHEDTTGRPLTLQAVPFFGAESYFGQDIPDEASPEPVRLGGNPGTAYHFGPEPPFVRVVWREATLEHQASVQLTPDFGLDALLELLETLG